MCPLAVFLRRQDIVLTHFPWSSSLSSSANFPLALAVWELVASSWSRSIKVRLEDIGKKARRAGRLLLGKPLVAYRVA
jgi:hypothetical protein